MFDNREFELTDLEMGHGSGRTHPLTRTTRSEEDFLKSTVTRATRENRVNYSSLEWRNISFKVQDRVILNNICGSVSPGRVCAIIGASGAGKTSLLNILAGRLQGASKSSISGEVFLNGKKIDPKSIGGDIAYVMQHDALFATQTPREALEFSAALRLPKTVTKKESTFTHHSTHIHTYIHTHIYI